MQLRFQGDVMIREIGALPDVKLEEVAREGGRIILAQGEATGHHHAVLERSATLLIDPETGDRFLVAPNGAVIVHEEHAPQELPPGTYRIGNRGIATQREYSPEEIRNVAD